MITRRSSTTQLGNNNRLPVTMDRQATMTKPQLLQLMEQGMSMSQVAATALGLIMITRQSSTTQLGNNNGLLVTTGR
jgi:hypothetical protein